MNRCYPKYFILGLAIVAMQAFASDANLPGGPYVIADGTAILKVVPDYAVVTFRVKSNAPTTAKAEPLMQKRVNAIFEVIRNFKIPASDIQASDVSVHASFNYQGDKQVYAGQDIERNFTITLHDLSKFSNLMVALLKADVSDVNSIDFDTVKRKTYMKEAMDSAIDDAHDQAEEMAKHSNAALGKIYAIASSKYRSSITRGFPLDIDSDSFASLGRAMPSFIVPKTIEIRYDVTAVYAITPN